MNVTLTLYKSLIVEAIKAETFIKGTVDRTVDDKNVGIAYHETAGDEEVHNRKIARCIETSLATLKSEVSNFLDVANATSATNVTSTEEDDKITVSIIVSDRFNQSMCDPLAKMFSKFIEDNSLVLWWGATNQNQAQFYQALMVSDLLEIKKMFQKTAPVAVTIPYTTTLSVGGSAIQMTVGGEETITYTIDDESIDDIEAVPSNGRVKVTHHKDYFSINALYPGLCTLTLYSRHDESISKEVDIAISEN